MVWSAFSFHGKSNLIIIITRQDSVEYQSHLQDNLLHVWNDLSGQKGIFMQDNARYHASFNSMVCKSKYPYSSDLDPKHLGYTYEQGL